MPENLRIAEERATRRKPQKAPAPPDDDLAGLLSASVTDVARMTGWSRDKIFTDLRNGRLRGYLHGGRRLVLMDSVRARLAELVAEPARLMRSPQPRRRI
jgi:hypothetical protein